ncbi:DUF6531 domain-containing protein [Rathayibacter toxicus]|uniref:DUF6531 domain-containing protein n=1 Tax=Rathayibacter toxicus TaxID=145458 RepID=UPI001C040000|nr:DUF6531 domain-containing protein [Rathayibacter toxicus]QWL31149.1 type IV secretion protein Rhs [Rathayibacter toxicus]
MGDVGAIDEDVLFSHDLASRVSVAALGVVSVIEGQVGSRASHVVGARKDFRGLFAEVFAENASVAAADGVELVSRLRELVAAVERLSEEAEAEQKRRVVAREWQRKKNERNVLELAHDTFFGEERPPVGPALEPSKLTVSDPVSGVRQTPASGQGGSGVSSACPADLHAFARGYRELDVSLREKLDNLRGPLTDFTTRCQWGRLSADGVVAGCEQWLAANEQDARWADVLASAFAAAGGEGRVSSLANGAVMTALSSAGVSVRREDIVISPPQAFGAPPTTGYADDPVNTSTGNFLETEVDLGCVGASAMLRFARTYNSLDERLGAFGRGWSSEAEVCLRVADDGATMVLPDGREVVFARQGEGWDRASGESLWLGRRDGYLVVSGNDGREWVFSPGGTWLSASAGPGTRIEVERDDEGRLVVLRHERGRSIRVLWSGERIVALEASDGRRVQFEYDGVCLVAATGPGGTRRYGWNPAGLVDTVMDAAGVVEVRNEYDQQGRVIAQISPFGRKTRYAYLPGRLTVVSDGDGTRSTTWVADARGRLVGVIDPNGRRQSMSYDGHGNLVSATERDGEVTVHAYDQRGRLVRTVTPSGADITVGYDECDRVTTVVTESGAVTEYEYPDAHSRNPCLITDPEGGRTQLRWWGNLLTEVVDPVGVRVQFEYDQYGDLIATRDADGNTARLERDEMGRVVAAISPLGAVTRFRYDQAGRLLSRQNALGSIWRYEYGSGGRLTGIVDPLRARTVIEYGEHGQPVATTDPVGRTVRRLFDDLGNVQAMLLPDGSSWQFHHDALSRLTETVDPSGAVWRREYDRNGALTATIDPTGVRQDIIRQPGSVRTDDGLAQFTTHWDPLGRPTQVEQQDDTVALTSYDRCGRPVELVDAEGALTLLRRDPAGRITTQVAPGGATTRFEYDHCGRLTTIIDPSGARTNFTYDPDGRVVGTTLPTGETTHIHYNAIGQVLSVTAPGYGTAHYSYDPLGRLTRSRDPWNGHRRFRYDPAGQLTHTINGLDGVTTYEYDQRGRNTTITDPLGNITRRHFDACDRAITITDPLGRTTTAGYDPAGRQTWQHEPTGTRWERHYDTTGREKSFSINGRLVSETHRDIRHRRLHITDHTAPTGPVEHTLHWNRRNQLIQRSRNNNSTHWEYNTSGARTAAIAPDGTRTHYERDQCGRITAIEHPHIGRAEFSYDPAGRLTHSKTGEISQEWEYQNGFLTSHHTVSPAGVTHTTIRRDENDRISVIEGPTGGVEYQYDTAGQLCETHTPHGISRWEYDPAGRLTQETLPTHERTHHYDPAGQLLRTTTSDGNRIDYVYDGLGRRVRETTAEGSERSYTWSDTGWLTAVTDRQPETEKETVTRLWVDVLGELATVNDTPLWWDSAAGSLDVIAIGDTPLLRTPGGITGVGNQWNIPGWRSERDTLNGDPWTANHATGANAGTAAGGDPFAGLSLPDGLALTTSGAVTIGGLEWMGHRAYDPTTRGFLSTDPLPPIPGTSWAANPYAFAGNDPVHALDPTGLSPITDTQLQAYRDGNHGVFAAAGDWLAHNWEYLAGAAMVIGGGALIATGIGGPIGGMLIAAGADVIIQKATTGSMDWTETAITAATGGLGRLVAGARLLAAAGNPIRETAVNAAEKAAKYAASPGPHTIDRLLTSTQRFITEGADTLAGALNRGTDTILKTIRSPLAEQITKVAHNALDQIEPRPSYFNTTITEERLQHIYHGELTNKGTWNGGHFWPGKPGKTPFPSNWNEEKIKKNILDIANDPTLEWKSQDPTEPGNFTQDGAPNRFTAIGERDGVAVKVVIEPMGDGIITAYPIY